MLFTEPVFLFVFLPALLLLYFAPRMPLGYKNLLLLSASLFFYAWGEKTHIPLILISICFNHVFGIWIERARNAGATAKNILFLGIAGNILFLGIFKYLDFAISNLNPLLSLVNYEIPKQNITLPIGISFFTFQAMSYLMDVARGTVQSQKRLTHTALYISLFPQLIAGPIVRYKDVAKQITGRQHSIHRVASGIRRFIIGLGKKTILADTFAHTADSIFGIPGNVNFPGVPVDDLTLLLAWSGAICYSLQIYFDFSGYSDMAIGLGRIFGFRFLENFRLPYSAISITDFWRRWHISLSSWFRDYLYIPLGGSRGSAHRTYRNLVIVFLLCGLWHGASWTYILWGVFHGTFLVFERSGLLNLLNNAWKPVRHIYVLIVVICGWVLFRSDNIEQAQNYYLAFLGIYEGTGQSHHLGLYVDKVTFLALIVGCLGSTPLAPFLRKKIRRWIRFSNSKYQKLLDSLFHLTEQLTFASILLLAAIQVAASTYSPFIYFRF